jgi:hypothetical protein
MQIPIAGSRPGLLSVCLSRKFSLGEAQVIELPRKSGLDFESTRKLQAREVVLDLVPKTCFRFLLALCDDSRNRPLEGLHIDLGKLRFARHAVAFHPVNDLRLDRVSTARKSWQVHSEGFLSSAAMTALTSNRQTASSAPNAIIESDHKCVSSCAIASDVQSVAARPDTARPIQSQDRSGSAGSTGTGPL